jgi:hypothetical protein
MIIRNLLLVAILGLSGAVPCLAQAAGGGGGGRMSFLSEDDRSHLIRVHEQVLAANPDLKTEQDSLKTQWQDLKSKGDSATPEDRSALRDSMTSHMKKMDAAMLKADPTVGPILEKIKAHMKERFHDHAGQGGAPADSGGQ